MRGAGSVWDFMTKKPFPNDFLALAFCCQGRRFWNLPRHVLVCRICHCSCRCCFRFIDVLAVLFFLFFASKSRGCCHGKKCGSCFRLQKLLLFLLAFWWLCFLFFAWEKSPVPQNRKKSAIRFFGLQKLLMFLFGPFLWIHEPTH